MNKYYKVQKRRHIPDRVFLKIGWEDYTCCYDVDETPKLNAINTAKMLIEQGWDARVLEVSEVEVFEE